MPALKAFNVTITAAAQPCSAGSSAADLAADVPYAQLWITTETDCFLGDSTVTTSAYGYKVVAAQTLPLVIGPFDRGPIKLSEIFVIGTSGKLHILGLPY